MNSRCSNCDHFGRDCPKVLMLLPLDDLLDWCQHVMVKNKITHELMARLSNTPKGTIDRVLARQSPDCRYSTIHAIVCALFEFLGSSTACLNDVAVEAVVQTNDLQAQNTELRKALADAEKDVQALRTRVEDLTESRGVLKDTVSSQRRAIGALAVLLGLSVLVISVALVVDLLHSSVGFIWR